MHKLLIYSSVFLFFVGLFYICLCIFNLKDRKTEKLTEINLKKIYKTEGLYSKLRKKIISYISKKSVLSESLIQNLKIRLDLTGSDKEPYEYIFDSVFPSVIFLILSIPVYFLSPLIGLLLSAIFILYGIMKIRGVYSKYNEIKEDIESHLCDFNRYIQRKMNETSDVYSIISSYSLYAKGYFLTELKKTISDMKTGDSNLALVNFDKRINSPMLSDIISGLLLIYSGEENKEYFILNEMKLTTYEEERLEQKAKSHGKRVKVMSIITLGFFIMTYAVMMINVLSESLTLLF